VCVEVRSVVLTVVTNEVRSVVRHSDNTIQHSKSYRMLLLKNRGTMHYKVNTPLIEGNKTAKIKTVLELGLKSTANNM